MIKSTQENISDLLEKAGSITKGGTTFFRGLIGNLNLFSSSEALIIKNQLFDETHYLLVPDPETEENYSLFTKRVIPEGFSCENDLPKSKIFHLSNHSEVEKIEELLIQNISNEEIKKLDASSPLADRLENLANEIDKKSNHITNGLIVIGGAVAIANPLLGVGIAAKALLPSLTSSLTTNSLDHIAGLLKKKKQTAAQNAAKQKAEKAYKKINPIIQVNLTLKLLSLSISSTDPQHDPLTESIELLNQEEAKNTLIAAEAITVIYAKESKKIKHPTFISWTSIGSKPSLNINHLHNARYAFP